MVVAWGCCFLLAACARALRRLLQLPAILCCEAMVWAITFLAFPLRMLTAVERERKLVRLVAEMQSQMDDLVWENRDLEEKLRVAIGERDAMEALLDEMEEEHEDAFARIDVLDAQLKELRQENMRLNEHKGKSMWDKAAAPRHGSDDAFLQAADKKPPKTPREEGPGSREWGEEDATSAAWGEAGTQADVDPASVLALAVASPAASSSDVAADETLLARQARAVARRRSLFSLGMSLAVGAVAWSADAPCLPLLAGLFAVVGVSMRSVSRLRQAADAVALLSLNWFLLGVLTSPMLPGVAHAVVPRAGRVLGPALTWIAAAAPL